MDEMSFFVYFFLGVFGLFFGSFLNVLADRLPHGRTILGRSKCESCKHTLAWYDLLPLISYALLQGKCRYCKAPFSLQYPAAEIGTSVIFMLTYYFSQFYYHTPVLHALHIGIVAVLIVMFLSDIRYQIIPDEMQIVLFILAIVRIFFLVNGVIIFDAIGNYLTGAMVVMLPLLLVFVLSKGKGMGFGDVKFAINMGLLLGLWNGLAALYIAFVSGGLIGGLLLLTKRGSMKSKIAFGPFLFLGTYLMLFFEYDILLFISKLYRFGP